MANSLFRPLRPSSAPSSSKRHVASTKAASRAIEGLSGCCEVIEDVPIDVRRLAAKLEFDNITLRERISKDHEEWEKERKDLKDSHSVELTKQAQLFGEGRLAMMGSLAESRAVVAVRSELEAKADRERTALQEQHEIAMQNLRETFAEERHQAKKDLTFFQDNMRRLQGMVQDLKLQVKEQTSFRKEDLSFQQARSLEWRDERQQLQEELQNANGVIFQLRGREQELEIQLTKVEEERLQMQEALREELRNANGEILRLRGCERELEIHVAKVEGERQQLHEELRNANAAELRLRRREQELEMQVRDHEQCRIECCDQLTKSQADRQHLQERVGSLQLQLQHANAQHQIQMRESEHCKKVELEAQLQHTHAEHKVQMQEWERCKKVELDAQHECHLQLLQSLKISCLSYEEKVSTMQLQLQCNNEESLKKIANLELQLLSYNAESVKLQSVGT